MCRCIACISLFPVGIYIHTCTYLNILALQAPCHQPAATDGVTTPKHQSQRLFTDEQVSNETRSLFVINEKTSLTFSPNTSFSYIPSARMINLTPWHFAGRLSISARSLQILLNSRPGIYSIGRAASERSGKHLVTLGNVATPQVSTAEGVNASENHAGSTILPTLLPHWGKAREKGSRD